MQRHQNVISILSLFVLLTFTRTIRKACCFSLVDVRNKRVEKPPFLWHRQTLKTVIERQSSQSSPRFPLYAKGFEKSEKHHVDQQQSTRPQRRRAITPLIQWATEQNVLFHKNVQLLSSSDNNDNLEEEEDYFMALTSASCQSGTVMLTVPKRLILSSDNVLTNELASSSSSSSSWEEALQGYEQHLPEFALLIKLLVEQSKGPTSPWHTWLESLPQTFGTTGICMNEVESSCLPSFALSLLTYERQKLEIFRKCLYQLESKNYNNLFDTLVLDDEKIEWAFNVAMTRCWKYQDDDDDDDGDTNNEQEGRGNAVIVPLGDMFNHNDPPNISVQDIDEDGNEKDVINFVLAKDVEIGTMSPQQLFLSYGMDTNPHRFLIHFGFCYDTMPRIFCQITFPSPSAELIHLGCNDRDKMVYFTKNGVVSDTVFNVVLYMLLAQVPSDREEFYTAFVKKDEDTMDKMLEKYGLEVCLTIRSHVVQTREELDGLLDRIYLIEKEEMNSAKTSGKVKRQGKKMGQKQQQHPRLGMIKRHNEFLRSVFEKVEGQLDGRIEEEKRRRRDQLQR